MEKQHTKRLNPSADAYRNLKKRQTSRVQIPSTTTIAAVAKIEGRDDMTPLKSMSTFLDAKLSTF